MATNSRDRRRTQRGGGWRRIRNHRAVFFVDVAFGKPALHYASCTAWNAALLERISEPGVRNFVVTNSSNNYAVVQGGRILKRSESKESDIDGLERSWRAVPDAGDRTCDSEYALDRRRHP
jgi:hypothetical protein